MEMGLRGRTVAVQGVGPLADHCAALLAAEGATAIDAAGDVAACDALIAIAPQVSGGSLDHVDDAATYDAWDHVTGLAERCRAATSGMAARGYGRIVWVGPLDAKLTRDDAEADLDALVGLGALGLMKAMSGELGPDGITCNSVLWDGKDLEAAGAAILFFASQPSGYVTGTALAVDGGKSGSVF